MKALQYFSDEYLQQCSKMTTEDILEFLEAFRLMQEPVQKSKLISIKIPEHLLASFRKKCEIHNMKYQTQIKELMREWLNT